MVVVEGDMVYRYVEKFGKGPAVFFRTGSL
jgi:hypothetical protein